MESRVKTLLACLVVLASHTAHADMWIYTDPQGVKHFASSQLDKRYALIFRAMPAPSVDSSEVVAGRAPAETRATDFSAKSLVAMEISPGFMAVKEHLRTAADSNKLDVALLQSVIHTESRFNPGAVSPKGAIGLMQVMPATAQRYGLANDRSGTVVDKLRDPKTNIQTGARYLRDLMNMFPGQLELAVAAYNAGEGAVQKAGNKIPNFKETQDYVRSVMQLYKRLNPQARAVPAEISGGRVKGQFHGANANVNLQWDEVSRQAKNDSHTAKTWRDPLHANDLVIGLTETTKAVQPLTELSN